MYTKPNWSPSAANNRRAAKRNSSYYSSIGVAGAAAVLMALLFLFLSSFWPRHTRASVDMVKAENAHNLPGANREDAMILAISRDGKVFFGGQQVELSDIAPRIREYVKAGAEKKVYLRPDARARNGDVDAVADQVRLAGVTNIAILTEKIHDGPAPKPQPPADPK